MEEGTNGGRDGCREGQMGEGRDRWIKGGRGMEVGRESVRKGWREGE